MYEGTQFQGGYYFQAPQGAGWQDLSSASFYRVKLTGENKLQVIYNKQKIDNSGNIINKK